VKLERDKQDEIVNDGSVRVTQDEAEVLADQLKGQLNRDQLKVSEETSNQE